MRGMPTWWQKLGPFQGCIKIDHVELTVFWGRRLRLRACYFSTSSKLLQFSSRALYDQFKASWQVVQVFDKFCISWSFLGEKMTINDRTCRNVHTVSEIIQTRYGCLTWACPLACKSLGSLDISKEISCSMKSVRIGQKDLFGSNSFLDIP